MRWHETAIGRAPVISSELGWRHTIGAWKVRWSIGRMSYRVPPGLYAIGSPDPQDPVLVTANYKMSYDRVRAALAGRNVWLVVLETNGVNVWCAAGKGSFGTDELVRRVEAVRLAEVVTHRRLLLPILGAPGVAAHDVEERTGFRVRYAAIRADDLPAYLDGGQKTTDAMRELTFTLAQRLAVVPVELVQGLKKVLPLALALFFASALGGDGFDWRAGLLPAAGLVGALLCGALVTPALLPWLPGRAFSVKGGLVGLVWAALFFHLVGDAWHPTQIAACLLLLPALSAFVAFNFTGCTPFTSLSGVQLEARRSLPIVALSVVAGAAIWVVGRVVA